MQSPTPMPAAGRSNIIAASIIAAGLVVSALIIARPSFSFGFPPISKNSVAAQFEQQVRGKMAGKTHYHFGNKRKLQEVKVGKVEYTAANRTYIVSYKLDWGAGDSSYNGCTFGALSSDFTGGCNIGDNSSDERSSKLTTITLR
jgi:hypothetical protein